MSEVQARIAGAAESANELETLLHYRFQDQTLLLTALTHRSFVNENEGQGLRHNESLEFLGDAVLGFLISARIFERFPDRNEGELSKSKAYLVSAVNLFRLAEKIRLGEFLLLSRGEEKTGGRKSGPSWSTPTRLSSVLSTWTAASMRPGASWNAKSMICSTRWTCGS